MNQLTAVLSMCITTWLSMAQGKREPSLMPPFHSRRDRLGWYQTILLYRAGTSSWPADHCSPGKYLRVENHRHLRMSFYTSISPQPSWSCEKLLFEHWAIKPEAGSGNSF